VKHVSSQRIRIRCATLAAIAATLVSACTAPDAVHIELTYSAKAGSPPLQQLLVFAGASKSSWPTVQAGESVSVVLPPDGEPPQLTMTFTLGTVPREWRGPAIAPGVGYRIGIEVTADGEISERHCEMPCSLD
jgi:hypothetical protein